MRAFIAIELSEEIRSALARIQSHLKYSGAIVKWVEEKNIHLTLKFLGEITEEKREKIDSILDEIGKSTNSFKISIKDIGAFPKIDYPKVIWVGLDKGAAESKILAERIDGALSKIGFEKEARPFAAHLTIGRVRSPKNRQALKEKITNYACPPEPKAKALWRRRKRRTTNDEIVFSVALFQSSLTPKGPIYTKLHEALLS